MRQLLALFLVISTLFSCKQDTKVVKTTKIEHLEKAHNSVSNVTLNDGNKWKANIETTDGIKKMQQILNSFSDKDSVEAYKTLNEKLEVEFTNIFTLCTMKGESHNQLHNYLKPMLPLFDGLNSNELKVCKQNYASLKEHLSEYLNYFE